MSMVDGRHSCCPLDKTFINVLGIRSGHAQDGAGLEGKVRGRDVAMVLRAVKRSLCHSTSKTKCLPCFPAVLVSDKLLLCREQQGSVEGEPEPAARSETACQHHGVPHGELCLHPTELPFIATYPQQETKSAILQS